MLLSISLSLALAAFAAAKTIDVQVGKGGLQFSPGAVFANAGDQVVFHFVAKNHSVTQSSFAAPCSHKDGGFDSGFHPVAANSTEAPPTFAVTVNDTQPIWVFCRQAEDTPASHCGQGMIFAINCGKEGDTNSLTNFKAEALAIGASLSAAAATPSATEAATNVATAAYGGYTLPPAPEESLATATITLDTSSVWTTTYTSYPGSNPTPIAVTGVTHVVVVGGENGLVFSPDRIDARPRDTVIFEFHQSNHSLVQSSFDDPCRKLSANGATGIDSGFMAVADGQTAFPSFNVTVNDTAPLWFYCKQKTPKSHCGAGMVFAINSVESSARNFTAFQDVAEALNGTTGALSTTGAGTGAASVARFNGLLAAAIVGGALLSLL